MNSEPTGFFGFNRVADPSRGEPDPGQTRGLEGGEARDVCPKCGGQMDYCKRTKVYLCLMVGCNHWQATKPARDGIDVDNLIDELIQAGLTGYAKRGVWVLVKEAGDELARLRTENERFRNMSTIEVMAENLNVSQHVIEWEARCIKTEAECESLRDERETWAKDSSADHGHIQAVCRRVGIAEEKTVGDCYGVPGVVDLADLLGAECEAAKKQVAEYKEITHLWALQAKLSEEVADEEEKRADKAESERDAERARADKLAAFKDWVWTWETINESETYIVCALSMAANASRALYLSNPQLLKGWQVSRLLPKCYASIPCPELPAAVREGN